MGRWGFVFGILGAPSIFWAEGALAQSIIVPDETLGAERSVVLSLDANGSPVDAIAGGAQRGQNLFHSFREFNISASRGAYFFSPNASIQNILARVTGSNTSTILGTLGSFGEGNPNLFLINPNGLIFGANASLNVQGSFIATTANGVGFNAVGEFSATNPQLPRELLTINPSAFIFATLPQRGGIVNQSQATRTVLGTATVGLQVPRGKTLLLLGGDVNVEGGWLNTWGGRVEIGAVSGTGIVGLHTNGSLEVPDNVLRADVSFTKSARIDVTLDKGGDIGITAKNVAVLGGSSLQAGISSGFGVVGNKSGDVTINATGVVQIMGESRRCCMNRKRLIAMLSDT